MDKNFLWRKFLKTEAHDFVEKVQIPIKSIREIGVQKFIKAMGWEQPSDIRKWRTDELCICICPHCKEDFGVLDFFASGLCKSCMKHFDLAAYHKNVENAAKQGLADSRILMSLFFAQDFYRNLYLKDVHLKNLARAQFPEKLTEYFVKKISKIHPEKDTTEIQESVKRKVASFLQIPV